MDYMQKIQYAANSYYNRGLELARERDLSGAAELLKRALQFNKYHTDLIFPAPPREIFRFTGE